MLDLGTLGGRFSSASALNGTAQVTGEADTSSGSAQAFLYSQGQMTELTLSLADSFGSGINNQGQVAGVAVPTPGSAYAFLYTEGKMLDLGTLGGDTSEANAINSQGQVAGGAEITPGNPAEHAFLYTNGQMTDLGTLGGPSSDAAAINNAGEVTGFAQTSQGRSHAFLDTNGQMTDLGTLPGYIYSWGAAINSQGQVVGYLNNGSLGTPHAFLYSGGQMIDLNDLIDPGLDLTLESATSINDEGQIVANTGSRAYLLTPVPEPSTRALCVLVLLGLGAWGYRRRRSLLRKT